MLRYNITVGTLLKGSLSRTGLFDRVSRLSPPRTQKGKTQRDAEKEVKVDVIGCSCVALVFCLLIVFLHAKKPKGDYEQA
jgi:hypothetical protein